MTDRVGKQLGNYRLTRLIGQGGFAEVYLGEHIYLKTQAAIKLLQLRLAHDEMETFLNEARTLAHLEHPSIVRVLDFGLDGNVPYLVMSYAPHGNLRQRHPQGTVLSPVCVISYVKQVAAALQYAHDQKLIHRDVKPENMLIGQHDTILLSDFGLVVVAQSSHHQAPMKVVGTPVYMAPEQLRGKPCFASDQYALGITIYEWLCGARPFNGSPSEVAIQHMHILPPPLHEKDPSILPAVEQVVLRALAKNPQQRFADIQEFAAALEEAYQSGDSISNALLPSLPFPVENTLKRAPVSPEVTTSVWNVPYRPDTHPLKRRVVLPSSSPLARSPFGCTSRGSLSRSVFRRTGCFPVPQGTC
jgi:eukaryotic-like serine/threonine-protein kinase